MYMIDDYTRMIWFLTQNDQLVIKILGVNKTKNNDTQSFKVKKKSESGKSKTLIVKTPNLIC